MTRIGISRQKPSGLRECEKILVRMAGLKNPIGDPHEKLAKFCVVDIPYSVDFSEGSIYSRQNSKLP